MLRVLTYNLLEGGHDKVMGDRTDTILEVLAAAKADVAVLIEANGFEDKGRRKLFEQATGTKAFLTETPTGFHIAFLVAERLKVAWHHTEPGRFFHGAGNIGIELKVKDTTKGKPGKRYLTVVGAHLDPFSPESRLAEARVLAGRANEGERVLLMGDFNSLPPKDPVDPSVLELPRRILARHIGVPNDNGRFDTRMHDVLQWSGFEDLFRKLNPKDPGWTLLTTRFAAELRSRMRMDFIYGTWKISEKAVKAQVIENTATRRASDHYPLLAEFDI